MNACYRTSPFGEEHHHPLDMLAVKFATNGPVLFLSSLILLAALFWATISKASIGMEKAYQAMDHDPSGDQEIQATMDGDKGT